MMARLESSIGQRDEIKRLRATELAVLDNPTARLPSPARGGGSRAAGAGGGGRSRPHKPGLDEMGIALSHEVKPARESPRSKLGRPGMRGGFRKKKPLDGLRLLRQCRSVSRTRTVVETPRYQADAERLFTTVERDEIVDLLANDPRCGVVIPGSPGVRKVRIGFGGRGKRGGARVLYVFGGDEMPVFLLAAFAKNEKDDLSAAERTALAKAVSAMLADYRRRK